MAVKFKAPRGTKDILPDDIAEWRLIEETFRQCCARYGYREIRTPAFEDLGLFERTAGETSDIVQKQMFAVVPYGSRHPVSDESVGSCDRKGLRPSRGLCLSTGCCINYRWSKSFTSHRSSATSAHKRGDSASTTNAELKPSDHRTRFWMLRSSPSGLIS